MEQFVISAVIAGGVYHLLFGILHLVFPFALRWKETLSRVDGTNRNLLPVFNLWVAYAIFAWSYVSFAYPDQVANTPLGHGICWSIAGIWTFRHMMQVYYMGFSGSYILPRKFLGLGSIHALAFAPIFSLGSAIYLIPILRDDVTAWVTTVAAIAGLLLACLPLHLRRASVSIGTAPASAPAMAAAKSHA